MRRPEWLTRESEQWETDGLITPEQRRSILDRYPDTPEKDDQLTARTLVWLAWLREPVIQESGSGQAKTRRTVMGGPQIIGQFRGFLAGSVHMMLTLEKFKAGHGAPGADHSGYARRIHTTTWENIEGGGRYRLPEPCAPHLGWIIDMITGRAPNPVNPQAQIPQPQDATVGAPPVVVQGDPIVQSPV